MIPKRRLGRTNEQVSMIGLGGFHLGQPHLADSDAYKLVHSAIDRGITFLDNCWDYNNGASELRAGRALSVGGYRDRIFLMTKIDGRTKASAAAQIDQSLARLLTDRIDLLQFHENIRADDADRIFAPGGRSRPRERHGRPARFATSASRVTRIRACICTCSTSRRAMGSFSIPCRCRST